MKKVVLVVPLILFAVLGSLAQHDLHLTLGSIPDKPIAINGKGQAIKTTRAQMIANDKLVMNIPGCEVKSYSFMIKVGTDITHGPIDVKGPNLTPEVIKIIQETKGPGVFAYFDEIKVMGPDRLMRSVRGLTFTFDQ